MNLGKITDYVWQILGVVLALVFLAFVLWLFGVFDSTSAETKNDVSARTQKISAMKYEAYENTRVLGSEVLSAVQDFKQTPQFSVLIKTGNAPSGFYAENTSSDTPVCYAPATPLGNPGTCSAMVSVSNMKDASNVNNYINKSASFDSKVYRDGSGNVRLIEFTQR